MNLSGTIVPWLLGTFIVLVLLSSVSAVKSWRDMKRSPYFFLRRQAEKRLQTYSFSSFGLILATLFIGTYAWQAPQDVTIARTALLVNDKPATVEVAEAVAAVEEIAAENLAAKETAVAALSNPAAFRFADPTLANLSADPTLPTEFDQVEPTAELKANTALGELVFSTDVTEGFEAVTAQSVFPEGFFTLFATFSYDEMEDGMAWSWIWKRDGEVISGGNELWVYGADGPGYVYLSPEEGFGSGEYTVEVWVNDELLTDSTVTVNNAAFSAGN